MSRCDLGRTDDSAVSVTESLKSLMASGLRYAGEMAGWTSLDNADLQKARPEQILSRMLSTKSYISTASSAAARDQDAQESQQRVLRQIGQGMCGTVWSITGTTYVLKTPQSGKTDQLYNDFCRHRQVQEAFSNVPFDLQKDINIPKCESWIHPTNQKLWNDIVAPNFQPTYGILSDRIYTLPAPVREAIVDAFAPKNVRAAKKQFLADPNNKDCLTRLYLGRRAHRSSSGGTFRLRNFPLEISDMEYLGLDTKLYATIMAQALAVLHWKAGVDGNDVEFVLGSNPQITSSASLTWQQYQAIGPDDARFFSPEVDFRQRSVGIWLLDFDQCKQFDESESGLKQLERGFYFNDPYYPTPVLKHPKDVELWETFKNSYVHASAGLTNSGMPQQFVAAVEAEGRRRSGATATGSLFG